MYIYIDYINMKKIIAMTYLKKKQTKKTTLVIAKEKTYYTQLSHHKQ